MILKEGQQVKLTAFHIGRDKTVDAVVARASPNGRSLILQFGAFLIGYMGAMPVWQDDDGTYIDLFERRPVKIEVLQ